MIHFFQDMAINPLLLSGLLGGLLAGLACGVIGPYVITRQIVFLSGAVAHTVIGGIGAVIFLRFWLSPALDGLEPLYGAVIAALLAALIIGWVQHHARERLDTLIGALWAIGMAVGLLLIKYTPGYHVELFTYLFGNIAVVSWDDVKLIAMLDLIILVLVLCYHKRLMALCLDPEYASLQGVSVLRTNLVLLGLVALTTVALIHVVGLILVIALLSLPAATASHFTQRMSRMIALSVVLCMLLTVLPRIAVYGTRLAPESAIILTAGAVYLLALAYKRLRLRSIKQGDVPASEG
ncbi:MAG: metal ABC transporter permease [Planctomycetota bacterium]|jgi:zinc transport system permease protein